MAMTMHPPNRRAVLRTSRASVIVGIVFTICLLRADPALAQIVGGGALDNAVDAMKATLERAGASLAEAARAILLFLVLFDFVLRAGKWVISSQSVGDFAEPMVYTIGIVTLAWGFSAAVPEVATWIAETAVNVAEQAQPGAAAVTPDTLRPSEMMKTGLDRAFGWLGEISVWNPSSLVYVVCAFISVIVMAAVLAMVIMTYAELYLVSMVGIVTLGFAGLSQTRGIASRYVMSLFGKGFKLMTLLILVDATERLARTAVGTSGGATMEGALSAVLLQVVGAVMIILLPGAVERLVAGSAVGDAAGTGAKMVAGAAASGGAAVAGAASGGAMGAMAGAAKGASSGAPFGGGGALAGALKGGVNWGKLGAERGISKELGSRLHGRINRVGTGTPKAGPEDGS